MGGLASAKITLGQLVGIWNDGAVVTNPGAAQVLATTGVLAAGNYFIQFWMHSTADGTLQVAKRDVGDSADIHVKDIPVSAGVEMDKIIGVAIPVAEGERFVVRTKGAITGDVQGTIIQAPVLV